MINLFCQCQGVYLTSVLNQVLNEAIAIVQPPTDKGKRLRIYYMTQASTKPPTFVVSLGVTSKPIDFKASLSFSLLSPSNSSLTF